MPTQLQASIDTPANRTDAGLVLFSGWACHPNTQITRLALKIGKRTIDCKYPLDSPDIAAAFPEWPQGRNCRFEALIEVPPQRAKLTLVAFMENGEEYILPMPRVYRFRKASVITSIITKAKRSLHFLAFGFKLATGLIRRTGRLPKLSEMPALVRQTTALFRTQVSIDSNIGAPNGFELPSHINAYDAWQRVNAWGPRSQAHLESRMADVQGEMPLVSIVMPVYRPPLEYLRQAIDSVRQQSYANWELCIADDAGLDLSITQYLSTLAEQEPRVRFVTLTENCNISLSTNAAAAQATGEFLLFLDNDDLLACHALAEVALHVLAHPETDYLYSDDDKIGMDGKRFAPQFKPDWSPELLLSYMYCAHLVVVRRSLFENLGGMRAGFEGSQDYDFCLRATEQARRIGHIPQVLYHWRVLPGSTASSGEAKPASFEAGRKAVQETLARRGIKDAIVYRPDWAIRCGVGVYWHDFADDGPTVAILIPTHNQAKILRTCLKSLQRTSYRNYRIVIIDNESNDSETLHLLKSCEHQILRIGNPGLDFSYAHINNVAVNQIEAEYILFLNNDTEVIEPRWLSRMVGFARLPGVGAVGARLLYDDHRIQHAGIVHGYYRGMAGPAFKLLDRNDGGYLSYAKVARNYSAVTAACMLTPRALFIAQGGFDETDFAVAYNDVDYCYRLAEQGIRSVYVPGAELYHHEGLTRGQGDHPKEESAFRNRYRFKQDPYYSPHLLLEDEQFRLAARRWVQLPMQPVRTLMTAYNLNLEGAPFSQYELTVALKSQGIIDPIVYCPEDGPLRALYEKAGITVEVFKHPLSGIFDLKNYRAAIQSFAAFIKQTQAQLVYGNTLQTFYAIAAAHEAGLPSLWNPREGEPWQTYFNHFGNDIAVDALNCFQYPYRVIFVSGAARLVCRALDTQHNFTVIPNSLDLNRLQQEGARWDRNTARDELKITQQDVAILILGTVCERKGQHDLVQAIGQLTKTVQSRITCFIVGDRDSEYSRQMARMVEDLPSKASVRVHIVAETHDTALYYKAADIFVCASRIESYPRVILEAMAHGLPIVTTPVFGIPEQVREGVNALFYQPGDIKMLAQHLSNLINDTDLRSKMAQASPLVLRTAASHQEMVSAYGKLFQEAYFSGDALPATQEEQPCAA